MLFSYFQHLVYVQDTQANYQLQITFTDRLQSKIDQMGDLALANGAELGEVNNIKGRAQMDLADVSYCVLLQFQFNSIQFYLEHVNVN